MFAQVKVVFIHSSVGHTLVNGAGGARSHRSVTLFQCDSNEDRFGGDRVELSSHNVQCPWTERPCHEFGD